MIVGVGGQGTLLTSRVLGNLVLNQDLEVKVSEIHGMAQRGGSVVTNVRFGEKVAEPLVEEGMADILLAFEKLEAQRYQHFLKEDGILIVNDQEIDPVEVITGEISYPEDIIEKLSKKHQVFLIAALDEALKIGNIRVLNMVLLGVVSYYLDFPVEEWEKVIRETVPPKTVEDNLKAFYKGREEVLGVCYD